MVNRLCLYQKLYLALNEEPSPKRQLAHPRTAEVGVGWIYTLNRRDKQREAKIPYGFGHLLFLAPSKTSASYEGSSGYFMTSYRYVI